MNTLPTDHNVENRRNIKLKEIAYYFNWDCEKELKNYIQLIVGKKN